MLGLRLPLGIRTAVGSKVLLDTGVIVALVNAADPDHARCREAWGRLRGRVYTVEGVLVEAAHLLSRAPGGSDAALGLVLDVGATLVAPTHARLTRARALMSKYQDTPMDLVDALLVVTAEQERVVDVLTLDRRGFETYRIAGGRRFRIQP
ncbi:MAG: type II toxin-antitoxin system VapC family toxin [Candidatus Binatia bacterium]